jgi:hypothetical protein
VRAVSYFRLGFLKRRVPPNLLASLDALFQPTGQLLTLSPSVFVRAQATPEGPTATPGTFFRCPVCGSPDLADYGDHLLCAQCGRRWRFQDGIYNFKEPA